MGGLWTVPQGTVKNDRKIEFCIEYLEISLCEIVEGVCTTFGKYLGIHTEINLKTTDLPYLYKELSNFRVPYCHVVTDLTISPAGSQPAVRSPGPQSTKARA